MIPKGSSRRIPPKDPPEGSPRRIPPKDPLEGFPKNDPPMDGWFCIKSQLQFKKRQHNGTKIEIFAMNSNQTIFKHILSKDGGFGWCYKNCRSLSTNIITIFYDGSSVYLVLPATYRGFCLTGHINICSSLMKKLMTSLICVNKRRVFCITVGQAHC